MHRASPLLAVVTLTTLCGCLGYHLGPSNGLAAGQKSVRVGYFANRTLEPRLSDAVQTALRRELQRDGTYHLATRGGADIAVTGTITRYDRYGLSFVPSDVLTVVDYRVTLTAQVTARDLATGKVIFDRPFTGTTLLHVGPDLTSAERQALPLLADDLARRVTALLADGTW